MDLSECGLVEFGARNLINRMLNLEASIYTWDQEHEERPSSVVLLRRDCMPMMNSRQSQAKYGSPKPK